MEQQREKLRSYLECSVSAHVDEDFLLRSFSALAIKHAEETGWVVQTAPGRFTIDKDKVIADR